jgi:adenylate cyclase
MKPTERSIRLATGLLLFSFATTHLVSHSFGVISVAAMQAAGAVLIEPWQSYPGFVALYGSFLVHGGLGLYALYRRRHVRIPKAELWQLVSGLAVPILAISHAANAQLNGLFNGVDLDYSHFLYSFFIVEPVTLLSKQFLLLLTVWIHGCIGIRMWLRKNAWYEKASPFLLIASTLVPTLALVGVLGAGFDIREAVSQNAALNDLLATKDRHYANPFPFSLDQVVLILILAYICLLAFVLGARLFRSWRTMFFSSVRITYPGNKIVSVAAGFSVLEASRWAGLPHESVCGGRGRCSTCRVRVIDGVDTLPAPGTAERRTLERIGAPSDVRLACQTRPTQSISVRPLVVPQVLEDSNASRFAAAVEGGIESEIAAMFVDLRESTKLASGRLPFDALFLFDRYIQAVTTPVNCAFGRVTSIAGDGVMCIFASTRTSMGSPARNALTAALAIWEAIDRLNVELAGELPAPLRIGIGVHVGVSVVGRIAAERGALQFLGETGNIAAKLEEQTKTLECTLAISESAILSAGLNRSGLNRSLVSIPGKSGLFTVVTFNAKRGVAALLADRRVFDEGTEAAPKAIVS